MWEEDIWVTMTLRRSRSCGACQRDVGFLPKTGRYKSQGLKEKEDWSKEHV